MMKLLVAAVCILFLSGCAERHGYPVLPTFPYEVSQTPDVTMPPDEDAFLRVAKDYVHQTRHWAVSDYRISQPQRDDECECLYYTVEYLPDTRNDAPGKYRLGGTPNSFGLVLDYRTAKIVKEFGLQ